MEPAKETPPVSLQADGAPPASPTTLEDIQKKLKEAEDRRQVPFCFAAPLLCESNLPSECCISCSHWRVQSIEAHKLERIHNEQAKIVGALRTCEQVEERKREEHAAALQRELEGSAKRREQHISELEQKLKKEVRAASLALPLDMQRLNSRLLATACNVCEYSYCTLPLPMSGA